MQFLNIWIGGKIPENRLKCIESFKSMMDLNDSYMILNGNDYNQAVKDKPFWIEYGKRHVNFKADFLRLYMACIYPYLLYADTDIDFNKSIKGLDFKPNKPYLGEWGTVSETSLFYVNNCCQWFKDFMAYLEKNYNPKKLFLPDIFMRPVVQAGVIKIPKSYFNHFHYRDLK